MQAHAPVRGMLKRAGHRPDNAEPQPLAELDRPRVGLHDGVELHPRVAMLVRPLQRDRHSAVPTPRPRASAATMRCAGASTHMSWGSAAVIPESYGNVSCARTTSSMIDHT